VGKRIDPRRNDIIREEFARLREEHPHATQRSLLDQVARVQHLTLERCWQIIKGWRPPPKQKGRPKTAPRVHPHIAKE